MANTDDKTTLKITLEDLDNVVLPQQPVIAGPGGAAAGTKEYGNITGESGTVNAAPQEKGSIFLQGWFYLGIAGLLGALLGWGVTEPFMSDGEAPRNGFIVFIMVALVIMFLCFGFSVAESIAERSLQKAMIKGLLSLALGLVFSVVFLFAGGIVYRVGMEICGALGVESYKNPAVWVARSVAWMVFAAASGLVYGLVDRSVKKGRFGVLGAVIGGGIGGILFDPISFLTRSGGPSRGVGFGLIGLAAGVAIGIVESALKDRWIYVAGGPLAGKQFILYKPVTSIGSSQQNDIYLFKDTSILPQHGSIEMRGAQTILRAIGPVFVSGQPVRSRVLSSGDLIQIGRYAFHFREKQR